MTTQRKIILLSLSFCSIFLIVYGFSRPITAAVAITHLGKPERGDRQVTFVITNSLPKDLMWFSIVEVGGPDKWHLAAKQPMPTALKKEGVGEVSGGGTQLSAPDADGKKSIEWIGVDVDLSDFDKGMPILKRELLRLGAPAATILEYTRDGKTVEEKLR